MTGKTPPTILVVDDYDDTREILRFRLESEGYKVSEAANGREAIEVARREKPALVLMDLVMPELDGFTAIRLMRDDPALKRVPVVVISAHEALDFRARAIEAGCDAFVAKPIHFDQLKRVMESILRGRQMLRTNAA